MAKRKYKRRSSNKNNPILVFLIIVIGLVILSFAISYFVTQMESGDDENITNKQETESAQKVTTNKHALEGTWASYNNGAMLTISGRNFSLEQPSVESLLVATGKIVIKEGTVTFVYTTQDSKCGIRPGIYEFKFEGSDEFKLTKIDDNCSSRSAQLVATWFKV